ncbi:pyridoxal-phosphate dependent enzyme [Streptomyces sp. NPDC020490]|uniref:pyridoxal-phosphate dependent enzyme n=1 Tax=Streptomyces sp. NPDC020490 TaxID=3365078 RepID=UPI00379AB690
MINPPSDISLESSREAHSRIAPHIVRTPLLRSKYPNAGEIFLKCDNLQVTGSFKVRGALNALLGYQEQDSETWAVMKEYGITTCSSGNFAQGLAHATRKFGIPLTVVVPDFIRPSKLERIYQFNSDVRVLKIPYASWRETMVSSQHANASGFFLSGESDFHVSCGIATIGLELLEDLPDVDAVLVPYGGGNLTYSLAKVLEFAGRRIDVYPVEISTGAPLRASVEAGTPQDVDYEESFIDGIGASFVIPEQFYRVREVISDVLVVTPGEVAESLTSLLLTDKLLCEGAGAAPFAAALKYAPFYGWRKPCVVISGGVIDSGVLADCIALQKSAA